MSERALFLHISALADDELALFTASLAQIVLSDDPAASHDDLYYQNLTLGVREARAFLRGRYSNLPAQTIDTILKFFSPNLAQTDTLSGGHFFAIMRLIVHVEAGKDVDRSLVFVQSQPKTNRSADNPFSSYRPQSSNNPFINRSKSLSSSRSQDSPSRLPPLPPRKSPPTNSSQPLPPPRHAALSGPPPPIKPSSHVTSTLMKQSLQASKTAQTLKRAEEQLEKERVLQVLKSSSTPSRNRSLSPAKLPQSSSSASGSDDVPPLPRRRPQRESPPMSTSSFERVALAGTSDSGSSPFRSVNSPSVSPTRNTCDLPNVPPPTHPDRKVPPLPKHGRSLSRSLTFTSEPEPSEIITSPQSASASPYTTTFEQSATADSPTSRVFRSKSMHHPSPPPLPPAPPPFRRKRPESFQHNARTLDTNDSPLSNFQRSLANLQPKLDALQPKLDKARYKAEAGLSKRGFIRDGFNKGGIGGEEEGLMTKADSVFDDAYAIDSPRLDDAERDWVDRDTDKWPSGGWKPL